ncbi:Xylose isomerase-like TIM barrel [uncultured Clostridium sp.]|nr:Xylose isomerase-like TIM barrel [uncultured Clostridium sp.]
MKKDQISINLESLQDRMGNTAEIRETMKGLKEAGYEYVEVLHFLNPDGGTTWKEILDECGMHASSIHELYEDIEKEPERMVEKAKSLGCKYIACGLSRFTVWEDENSLKELTDGLNRLGKYFKEQGLELLYHNHNMEFAKYDGKHTALEYIFANTDPEVVGAELDAYWVHLSGSTPAAWCQKLGKRLKAIHLKDLGVTGISTPEKYIKTPSVMALGYGNLDIEGIVKAADEAGCQWFIVETHTGWINNDSLYTAGLSYKYLMNLSEN